MGKVRKSKGTASRNYVDVISISRDRLQLLIHKFSEKIENKIFWITPLGVSISLFCTLLVSEFRDKFGITGVEWRLIAIISCVGFAMWAVWTIFRSARRQTLEEFMEEIAASSLAPPRHYGLPIFWAKDERDTNYMLVYFDPTWDCYLCPYVSLHSDQTDPEDVSEPAADRFGLPKQALRANELVGHVISSQKKSEASHNITNYRFAFYLMKVANDFQDLFLEREFEVQGRQYCWLTIEQVLAHTRSVERNGEVFRYVRDQRQAFFDGKQTPSLLQPIKS